MTRELLKGETVVVLDKRTRIKGKVRKPGDEIVVTKLVARAMVRNGSAHEKGTTARRKTLAADPTTRAALKHNGFPFGTDIGNAVRFRGVNGRPVDGTVVGCHKTRDGLFMTVELDGGGERTIVKVNNAWLDTEDPRAAALLDGGDDERIEPDEPSEPADEPSANNDAPTADAGSDQVEDVGGLAFEPGPAELRQRPALIEREPPLRFALALARQRRQHGAEGALGIGLLRLAGGRK